MSELIIGIIIAVVLAMVTAKTTADGDAAIAELCGNDGMAGGFRTIGRMLATACLLVGIIAIVIVVAMGGN